MTQLSIFDNPKAKELIKFISANYNPNKPLFAWIDLFCGCGGVTQGYSQVENNFVVACVNHDPKAIESHYLNHPESIHYTEDIREWEVIIKLKYLVNRLRISFPDVVICLHASLECTHFSKAKGGMARDADSRTLAEHLFNYNALGIDYITIENVEEFKTWGPLDNNGQPIKEEKGKYYERWKNKYKRQGYKYESRILNSADFGAYTSRKRYFAILSKKKLPVAFPQITHVPRKLLNKFPHLQPYKAVRDMLDLSNEGQSLFENNRNGKPYAEATFARVYHGLLKFYKEGAFRVRYNGGDPIEKSKSLNKPLGTILCNNTHSVVKPIFLTSYYGGSKNGNGVHSLEGPCPTVTTKDRFALHHLQYQYGNATYSSIQDPCSTITTVPKAELITSKWLFDHQFKNTGSSINRPAPTIIARQDKKPLYLASASNYGIDHSKFNPYDSDIKIKLRRFMRKNGIIDIKIRQLTVQELKEIQGFPNDYQLVDGVTAAKKQIGNSVVPLHAEMNAKALYEAYCEFKQIA